MNTQKNDRHSAVALSPPNLGGVRGGLNVLNHPRNIRVFRPPLAPPNLGGELVTITLEILLRLGVKSRLLRVRDELAEDPLT